MIIYSKLIFFCGIFHYYYKNLIVSWTRDNDYNFHYKIFFPTYTNQTNTLYSTDIYHKRTIAEVYIQVYSGIIATIIFEFSHFLSNVYLSIFFLNP